MLSELYKGVLEYPDDTLRRSMYADARLEQYGDSDIEGQFILNHIAASQMPQCVFWGGSHHTMCSCKYCELMWRCKSSLWTSKLRPKVYYGKIYLDKKAYRYTVTRRDHYFRTAVLICNGMVGKVYCTSSYWVTHGRGLVRQYPITEVEIFQAVDSDRILVGVAGVHRKIAIYIPGCPHMLNDEIRGTILQPDEQTAKKVVSDACIAFAKNST